MRKEVCKEVVAAAQGGCFGVFLLVFSLFFLVFSLFLSAEEVDTALFELLGGES